MSVLKTLLNEVKAKATPFEPSTDIPKSDVQAAIDYVYDYGVAGFQPLDSDLTAIAALTPTDSNVIVGNGSAWVAESGATARTSLGLGAGDSPSFAGLGLSSGAIVNFNSGDVTITHSANALTIGGATAIAFGAGTVVRPGADDGATLGASGTAWSDLFLASGSVVSWNAGDVTLTHGTNSLTFAAGDGRNIYFGGGDSGEQGAAQRQRGISVELTSGNTGSITGTQNAFNYFRIADDALDATGGGGSKANGMFVYHTFGSSAAKGGRHAGWFLATHSTATSATNTDRNYVGVVGQAISNEGDGGGSGTEKGAYFGVNGYARLDASATFTTNVTGGEFNTLITSGGSSLYRSGIQIAGGGATRGSTHDCAIGIGNLGAATTTWLTGIKFGTMHGDEALGADSTVIHVASPTTIDRLIDASTVSFTTAIMQTASVTWTDTSLNLKGADQGLEMGSLTGINTPHIDFHSSGNNIDYDSRIIASGGSGSIGQGAIKVIAAGGFSPATTDTVALGTTSLMWSDLFLASGSVINFDNSDVTITHSSNALTVAGATAIAFGSGTVVRPGADDGATLGASGTAWSDLFLASGSVINFNASDVTITHSANALTIGGAADIVFAAGTTVRPGGNDNATLGSATISWSDLFLASGGAINFNDGNATLTHSAGNLTSSVPVTLPSYVVASLPTGAAGRMAFASNGRKNGEGAAAGTGVLVFHDGTNWCACDTGATVAA
jgi:hypothetical protein